MNKVQQFCKEHLAPFYNVARNIYHWPEVRRIIRNNENLKARLKNEFSYLLERYQNAETPAGPNAGPIWVCWWQGEEQMPEIVRTCYRRLQQMAPAGHPVILITKDTVGDYITLPEHITKAVEEKRMTLTHFSDLLRAALLSQHGGIWVDSTIYVTAPIAEELFQKPYFSTRRAIPKPVYVSRCLYTGFLIGCVKGAPWLSFARDMLFDYWQKHDTLVNYFLIDQALIMGYDNIPSVTRDAPPCILPQVHLDTFMQMCSEPYDEKTFADITATTRFLKLNWRMSYTKQTADGRETYFGHLISQAEESR